MQGPHLTIGVTITNHHKTLSSFAAVLAPALPIPHSGLEAPRGPHPGNGHRNRTIFSPGQAEALEKGAGLGSGGAGVLGGSSSEAFAQRLRGTG
jgi:paired box protein 4